MGMDRRPARHRGARLALLAAAALLSSGCASLANKAAGNVGDALAAGVVDQDDPLLVGDGLPSYLLLIDGLLAGDPKNLALLIAGARLQGAYGAFLDDPARKRARSRVALDYARRAACVRSARLCAALDGPHDELQPALETLGEDDVPTLYALAVAWAGAIEADSEDFDRIAELPKVEALLRRVVALVPDHDAGTPQMYLGVLASLRPASLGGDPEAGKAFFEAAIAHSEGRNLMAKTLYAQYYARLVFDQALHDRLLAEVLAADPRVPKFTLSNVLAQRRARELVESGKDYF
jgi:hypothetical protein